MSEASDLLEEGFRAFVSFTDSPTLTVAGFDPIPCIAPPNVSDRLLMATGYWDSLNCRVEVLRSDALRVGLKDRLEVTYTDARGVTRAMRIQGPLADDSADPCLSVTLKEDV